MNEVVGVAGRGADSCGGVGLVLTRGDQGECGCALGDHRRRALDAGMRAVGGDEVDLRFRMLQVVAELVPALVGLEDRVLGLAVQLGAYQIDTRHAFGATARDVEGGEV